MKRLAFVAMVVACHAPVPPPVPPAHALDVAVAPVPAATKEPMPITQTATPQELVFPNEAFRATQPAPTAPRPFQLPEIQPFTLANGLKVFLVEQHTLPLVSMDLNFDGGDAADPRGKEGLAGVCMAMLTEGTEELDKIQYAEALADVASSVSAYAMEDSQGVSMSTLTKHLDATFELFVGALRKPGVRASDFERMIKRRIEGVKQAKSSPTGVESRVRPGVLYGPGHPLGGVTTEASFGAITLDDCKAYHQKWLQPKGARLFVVGDLTEAQIRQRFAGRSLAGWTGAGATPPAIPTPATRKGRIFFVDFPGAAQSVVSMLHFGPKRTSPDFFATTTMAAVFGGGFASRFNMNVREDKGYSYGARGGFDYTRQFGVFRATTSVRTDATYQTVLEIDREVKDLWSGKRPANGEELERETQGAILGFPARFATAQSALAQYRGLVYYGLPLDYYRSYTANVGKVTAAQVNRAAATALRPGQAVYLVVGDGSQLVIRHDQGKDVPYEKAGKQLTLREALADVAARGDVGAGGLVELDTDGNLKP